MTATTIDTAGRTASPALRWYVLIVMSAVYAISIADRYVVSTVLEPIRQELRLSDGGVAILTGGSLALFYVTLGIPLSWLADRMNRRNLLAFSLIAWSAMSALTGLSVSYLQLMLTRIGVGIGEAGGTPAANSIIGDCFPAGRRPMAMTIFALGAPVGAWVAGDLAGAVAHLYGWRAAFLALAAPGVIVGLLVLFTIREPARGCLDAGKDGATPTFWQTLVFLTRQKAGLHLMMGGGLSAFWGWGLMFFAQTFLQRTYHLDVGQAGSIIGDINLWPAAPPRCSPPGYSPARPSRIRSAFSGCWRSSPARRPSPRSWPSGRNALPVATAMLWLFIPSIYFYIGPAMGLVQNVAPPKMRAMFIAISLVSANVLNLMVAPALVGWLSDRFAGAHGPDAASLRLALLILAPTGFWAAWHYWAAIRNIEADQRRAIGYA